MRICGVGESRDEKGQRRWGLRLGEGRRSRLRLRVVGFGDDEGELRKSVSGREGACGALFFLFAFLVCVCVRVRLKE